MKKLIAAAAVMTLALVGLAVAQDRGEGRTDAGRGETKTDASKTISMQCTVRRGFKKSKVLLVRIDRIDDTLSDAAKKSGLEPGHLIYVHFAPECSVVNEKGKNLKREADDDEGFKKIDDDGNVLMLQLDTSPAEVNLRDGDIRGNIQGFEAKSAALIKS